MYTRYWHLTKLHAMLALREDVFCIRPNASTTDPERTALFLGVTGDNPHAVIACQTPTSRQQLHESCRTHYSRIPPYLRHHGSRRVARSASANTRYVSAKLSAPQSNTSQSSSPKPSLSDSHRKASRPSSSTASTLYSARWPTRSLGCTTGARLHYADSWSFPTRWAWARSSSRWRVTLGPFRCQVKPLPFSHMKRCSRLSRY